MTVAPARATESFAYTRLLCFRWRVGQAKNGPPHASPRLAKRPEFNVEGPGARSDALVTSYLVAPQRSGRPGIGVATESQAVPPARVPLNGTFLIGLIMAIAPSEAGRQ